MIVACEPIPSVPVKCVSVDSPSHLFLVTDSMIPTHNTLTGAQWVKKKGLAGKCRIALVAPTRSDVRGTMIEGETGILSVFPNDALLGGSREVAYNRTTLEVYLANGTYIQGFTSEEPNRLRGPQFHYLWGEEVSSWNDAAKGDVLESTWSNAKLCCRLGVAPQFCLTSTPKPNKLTKQLIAIPEPTMRVVSGSSYENRDNLSEVWWQQVVAPLEGTRTGMQEIHALVVDDVEGALWTRAQLEELRIEPGTEPPMKRVVVAVDPQGSTDEASNEAGIIVVGAGHDGLGYVLADYTPKERGPWAWGQAAVQAYHDWHADRLVAETNFGAAMVEYVIKTVDPTVAFKAVTASRGKRVRAEPIAALYEGDKPKIRHVGMFEELETEQVTWTPDADSPNRLDALVWGFTELKLWTPVSRPRIQATRAELPVSGNRWSF